MKIYIHCSTNYNTIEYHCNQSENISSWLSDAKEIGIHCGTIEQAESIQNGKPGSKIYELTLKSGLSVKQVEDPDPDGWCSLYFLDYLRNIGMMSQVEHDNIWNDMLDCNSPESKSKILREFLHNNKHTDLLVYLNEIEGTGSADSYIILDNSAIENIEEA